MGLRDQKESKENVGELNYMDRIKLLENNAVILHEKIENLENAVNIIVNGNIALYKNFMEDDTNEQN